MKNLTELAIFAQVVESKSFSAAAAQLGLSKSAVSKYIARLEADLGARLLNRYPHALKNDKSLLRLYPGKTNSWHTPRTSISYSTSTTGGRA
jgi:DNA-binding transcriptional LysR family regulator